MTLAELEVVLEGFEGLVKETASQIIQSGVELEFDDVRQLLRVKVWQAVLKFDEARAANGKRMSRERDRFGRTQLQRFVFMCVANVRKDIEKRPRRFNSSVEGLRDDETTRSGSQPSDTQARADRFDAKYLSVDAEKVFAQIEDDDPPLPSTLTEIERRVVHLRLEGRHLFEIDRALGLSRAQRERVMESLREKLADLRPEPRSGPTPPLPRVAPQPTRVHAPLAA